MLHDHDGNHIYTVSCFQRCLLEPFSVRMHQSVPSSLPTLNSGKVHFHNQIHTLPYQTAVVSLSTHLSLDLSLAWRVWTSSQIVLTENTTCYKNKWCAFKLFAIN